MKFLFLVLNAVMFFNFCFADDYREKIQPIFNNRCIACHSCFNGPCQLNLQSYEGFERGANKENVYDGTRLSNVHPTRLGIDARTIDEWRKLKFFSVNQSKKLDENIFYQMIRTKPLIPRELPTKPTEESVACMSDAETVKKVLQQSEDLKMPYGLLPISEADHNTLGEWLKNGAPGPTDKIKIAKEVQSQIHEWELFFNQKSLKEKLVSRYLYEHLFLAHIYFKEEPRSFFRLVRSEVSCEQGVVEIATRRPNENPGRSDFFYCLKPYDATIVAKTHMPFMFSNEVLNSIKKIFFSENWDVAPNQKLEELYSNSIAENPFIAFKDIPVSARYKFLLENAYYTVSTFIKGPVCNGSNALNSIQEQFFVLFLKPESGFLTAMDGDHDEKTKELLIMPGVWGSDVKLADSWSLTKTLSDKREEYRKRKATWLSKNFSSGLSYGDLWNGDGVNTNAMLTVFRHDDNAVVLKGFRGDLSKTIFVLDYSLLERLVYNLVVNFDVFGNVGHQMLTRIYMDYIRMEAEENFLLFLPAEERLPIRKSWYKGILTEAKMSYVFPLLIKDHPTKIKYKNSKSAKREFVQHVLRRVMPKDVRGNDDLINWKNITPAESIKKMSRVDKTLREIASLPVKGKMRFPNFFPEVSYLIVKNKDKSQSVFSMIKNREHENISWILGESLRLSPEEDTLSIVKGFHIFYPNYFFEVEEDKLDDFKNLIFKISNLQDFKNLMEAYGVSRTSEKFWGIYDQLNESFSRVEPVSFGYLDLTRYWMQ